MQFDWEKHLENDRNVLWISLERAYGIHFQGIFIEIYYVDKLQHSLDHFLTSTKKPYKIDSITTLMIDNNLLRNLLPVKLQ